MIPGQVSRLTESVLASATTIRPRTDLVRLTGSTAVATITPPFGFSSFLIVVPVDGALVFGTGGNILVGATVAQNRPCLLIYSKGLAKWLIGPIS